MTFMDAKEVRELVDVLVGYAYLDGIQELDAMSDETLSARSALEQALSQQTETRPVLSEPSRIGLYQGPDDCPQLMINDRPVAIFPAGSWAEVCDALDSITGSTQTDVREEAEYEYEVWQDGDVQAGGSAPDYASAKSEANHYAMMYNQDGPVEIIIYEKRRVAHARRSQRQGPAPCKHDFRRDEDHGGACCQLCGEVRQ